MHARHHYAINRALAELNTTYRINNAKAIVLLQRVASQCTACAAGKKVPKPIGRCPIISERFGERVGMDLKMLGTRGYMLTVVDHFTNYCWLGHVPTKFANGIVRFFCDKVLPDMNELIADWKAVGKETSTLKVDRDIYCVMEEPVESNNEKMGSAPANLSAAGVSWSGVWKVLS